jgi:hypothetical protein
VTRTPHTPSQSAAAYHRHPFTRDPGRWQKESTRALRTGHVRDSTCSPACQPVLVHERTSWGWLAWTVPADGTLPQVPHQIGVLTPFATRTQRLALRWLSRRPAQHIALTTVPGTLRFSVAAVALISVIIGLFAIGHGVPIDVALPVMLLAPLLAEYLPGRLDARADEHVRRVEGVNACRYLQRLATMHTSLVQARAVSDGYELRHSAEAAEAGHHLLWDAAGLLQSQDTRSASEGLSTRELLMLQLVDQVAQILGRAAHEAADADQPREPGRPLGPYPPGSRPTTPRSMASTPPLKGTVLMPQPRPEPSPAVRTPDVYLLFAHKPYYPGPGAQEINTTVVAADSLLHPKVRQPDGVRIHDLLTQGRQPGEIIPLATLTHELNGGADWPKVGDWQGVTTDLLQLVHTGRCDALSVGLPEIARALLCVGPHSHVRTYNAAAGDFVTYGSAERAAVLDEVGRFLAGIATEQPFWPGDSLLPPLGRLT